MVAPVSGKIVIFGASADSDFGIWPKDQLVLICGRKPDFDQLQGAGYSVSVEVPSEAGLTVVLLPRAKVEARAMIEQAVAISTGSVIVDGQKTDGIDSIFKEMRKRANCSMALSKAHGKLFVVQDAKGTVDEWAAPGLPQKNTDGFVTSAGVFSTDGIDPASKLLAAALPEKLGRHVVDLGAGWGYLASQILSRSAVEHIDLVEADHAALVCAEMNVTDPRAAFYWADATTWKPANARVDSVVMNPPFHVGRKGLPDLGRAFIASAAGMLAPGGHLWMVANRHLPYEDELARRFGRVEEIGSDTRFKLFAASRPSRQLR